MGYGVKNCIDYNSSPHSCEYIVKIFIFCDPMVSDLSANPAPWSFSAEEYLKGTANVYKFELFGTL